MNSLNVAEDFKKQLTVSFEKVLERFRGRPQMMWVAVIALSGVLALVWDSSHSGDSAPAVAIKAPPTQLSALIPAGFVLVPIQVSNFESLDSILGPYGVVDLFVPALTPGARARKVASRVKIVRAPQNPSQFAVLVESSASEKLLAQGGSFFAVIQNTKDSGTGIVMNTDQPKRVGHSSRLIMEAP